MELRTLVIVAAVVVLVAAVYHFGGIGGGGEVGRNATAILLAAADRAAGTSTYVMESETRIGDMEPIYSKVTVSGSRARVDVKDAFGVLRSIYFLQEGEFVCLPDRKACVAVDSNTTSSQLKNVVAYGQGQVVEVDVPKIRRWVTEGVIDVEAYLGEKEMIGRRCEQIRYRFYFDLMREAELLETGYSAQIAPYISSVVADCLDLETGFALYKEVNTTVLGEPNLVKLTVLALEKDVEIDESVFALAGELVNETEFVGLDAEEVERRSCLLLPDEESQNECFEEKAFNWGSTQYCDFIEAPLDRERCYMIFVPRWKDPALCEGLDLLRDDCYYEIALGTENLTACGRVADGDLAAV